MYAIMNVDISRKRYNEKEKIQKKFSPMPVLKDRSFYVPKAGAKVKHFLTTLTRVAKVKLFFKSSKQRSESIYK